MIIDVLFGAVGGIISTPLSWQLSQFRLRHLFFYGCLAGFVAGWILILVFFLRAMSIGVEYQFFIDRTLSGGVYIPFFFSIGLGIYLCLAKIFSASYTFGEVLLILDKSGFQKRESSDGTIVFLKRDYRFVLKGDAGRAEYFERWKGSRRRQNLDLRTEKR
ncbi:hypothetical protein [Pseudoxanthomonas sp. JBR18]|uniref:hypothetical protein n=1 Tax=Pseudoxanthomonas sp. JBR18 TaxID=2969308 RepID=UPI002305536E|nr:hypothetical protein [Pseudoxanthomonas sp. JBR18]WCE05587.1 hypothetical protein PJ250_06430 [Pseudoxanthomonas sp. JBR18]